MNYNLVIRKKAESQITDSFDWYEKQRGGLGENFLLCIDAALMTITNNPLLYQIRHKNIRLAIVPRFPFGVFYFIAIDKIIVIAVLHLSRDPKLWKT